MGFETCGPNEVMVVSGKYFVKFTGNRFLCYFHSIIVVNVICIVIIIVENKVYIFHKSTINLPKVLHLSFEVTFKYFP